MSGTPSPNATRAPRIRLSSLIRVGMLAAVLVTTASLLLVVNHYTSRYAKEQMNLHLQQLAWQAKDALDRGIQERFIDISLLTTLASTPVQGNPTALRSTFEKLQAAQPYYAWIGLADTDGQVLAATSGLLEGVNVSERPWFNNAKNKAYAGDYHPAVLLEKKLPQSAEPWRFIDVAMPVYRTDGTLRGVIGAHLSWGWARDLAQRLFDPAQTQYGVEILIVRQDGTVLLGPPQFLEKKISLSSVTAAQQGKSGALQESWPDGTYVTSYTQTHTASEQGMGWSILVRQPVHIATAGFIALEQRLVYAGALIALLLTLAASALARKLTRPLNALIQALEQRTGNQDGIALPDVGGYHEAHLLSSTLSTLIATEKSQRHALRRLSENLENEVNERTAELRAAAEQLQTALLDQHAAQQTLQESEAELRAILNNAHDAFIAVDQDARILEWNPQAERLFGWHANEAIGCLLTELVLPPEESELYLDELQRYRANGNSPVVNQRSERIALRRDGSTVPVEVSFAVVERTEGPIFISFLHDISERRALQASLEQMAWQDSLTTLPNRRSLLQILPRAMARTQRSGMSMAILFLDLDGFKGINDAYGHDTGDELLRQFAARISSCVRNTDTVARLGGDEFTVILEQQTHAEQALEVARKLLAAMETPFALAKVSVYLTTSIGIALFKQGMNSPPDALLDQADQAMYSAKKAGKNQVHIAGDASAT